MRARERERKDHIIRQIVEEKSITIILLLEEQKQQELDLQGYLNT